MKIPKFKVLCFHVFLTYQAGSYAQIFAPVVASDSRPDSAQTPATCPSTHVQGSFYVVPNATVSSVILNVLGNKTSYRDFPLLPGFCKLGEVRPGDDSGRICFDHDFLSGATAATICNTQSQLDRNVKSLADDISAIRSKEVALIAQEISDLKKNLETLQAEMTRLSTCVRARDLCK